MTKIIPYIFVGLLMAIALYFKFNFYAVIGATAGLLMIIAASFDFYRMQQMKKIADIDPIRDMRERLQAEDGLSEETKEEILKQFRPDLEKDREYAKLKAKFLAGTMHSESKFFGLFIAGVIVISVSIYFLNKTA